MKIFSASIGLVGCVLGCVAGCAVGGTSSELLGRETAAVCSVPDATTSAVAELAAIIGSELHRWELLTDFYLYTGYGSQQMLGLTAAGLAQCGGTCPLTSSFLGLQDPRMDQMAVFGGNPLSASSFASRLTSGFVNQQTCGANGQCPYEAHVLGFKFVTPQTCDDLDTYSVSRPGGGNLTSPANLTNALFWTADNGPNPLIAFRSTATTVTIDPTGQMNGGTSQGIYYGCNVDSTVDLTGAPCTCATTGVNNGELKLTHPIATPNTYYCVTQYGCSVNSPSADLTGDHCTCASTYILLHGTLKLTRPVGAPNTYFCIYDGDRCQIDTTDTIPTGASCRCAERGIVGGHFVQDQALTPSIYYCRP